MTVLAGQAYGFAARLNRRSRYRQESVLGFTLEVEKGSVYGFVYGSVYGLGCRPCMPCIKCPV